MGASRLQTTPDHAIMLFCRRYNWTYNDYMSQPADVIARWHEYEKIEAQFAKLKKK